VPYQINTSGAYSYTLYASANPTTPLSNWTPLADLVFNTSAASFTHTNALTLGTQMYYRVGSP
jgi:hypothetical protein